MDDGLKKKGFKKIKRFYQNVAPIANVGQRMFHCASCNFDCIKKGDWKRHVLTKKHGFLYQAHQTILEQNKQLCNLVLEQQAHLKKQEAVKPTPQLPKDALEWSKFLSALAVDSYSPGLDITDDIVQLFCKHLDHAETVRPVYCLDLKRKKLTVHTSDGWVHDAAIVLQCMSDAVQHIQHQLLRFSYTWQTDHPNWTENESEANYYVSLVQHTSASVDLDKFIGTLCKKVLLD